MKESTHDATRSQASERLRFTTIAHGNHTLCSPLSEAKLGRLVTELRLGEGARSLELCTGKAELLLRIAAQYETTSAVGVDFNAHFLELGRREVRRRALGDRIRLLEQDAWAPVHDAPESGWDLVANIGGARLHDSPRETLAALRDMTRAGGLVLVGDGYWRRGPAPGYLEALGATKADLPDHAGNVRLGAQAGLTLLYSCVASVDEFDHYEGLYLAAMERWLSEHAQDPSAEGFSARIRTWRDTYYRWGRDTLGFGVYLYQRPNG